MPGHSSDSLRLAELMAALSIATDYGMGQPFEAALQACRLALWLAEHLGFGEADLRAVYYQALLRYIGCNTDTHLLAAIVGDELALRTDIIHADSASPELIGMMARFIRHVNAGAAPLRLAQAIVGGLAQAAQFTKEFFTGHREIAHHIYAKIGVTTRAGATLFAVEQDLL